MISYNGLTHIFELMLMYSYIDLRGREHILTLLPLNGHEVSAPPGASLRSAYVPVSTVPACRLNIACISTPHSPILLPYRAFSGSVEYSVARGGDQGVRMFSK